MTGEGGGWGGGGGVGGVGGGIGWEGGGAGHPREEGRPGWGETPLKNSSTKTSGKYRLFLFAYLFVQLQDSGELVRLFRNKPEFGPSPRKNCKSMIWR